MSKIQASSLEIEIFERLATSRIFSKFESAFSSATGLPLRFIPRDEEWCIGEPRENESSFCRLLNQCETACSACKETNRRLIENAIEVEGPQTCGCFTGLCATAVPVKLGRTILGFLKTGQVFKRQPTEDDFSRIINRLTSEGNIADAYIDKLHTAYFQTQQVDPARYESMVTLLNLFAEQLSEHAETVSISTEDGEPKGITAAKRMIHQNLEDPIELDSIAKAAGMSRSHFCRTFKEATSMTVTEYITRARINWAGKELLRPNSQISETAYKVGFQSLSQFNRSFTKITGMSPSAFRKEKLSKAAARAF